MLDAAQLQAQMTDAFARAMSRNKKSRRDWGQLLFVVSLIALCSQTLYQSALGFIPMRVDDFHRLDAAIARIASSKNDDPDKLWQQIYLQLRIRDISDLRMNHVDDVSRIILDEIGKNDFR